MSYLLKQRKRGREGGRQGAGGGKEKEREGGREREKEGGREREREREAEKERERGREAGVNSLMGYHGPSPHMQLCGCYE